MIQKFVEAKALMHKIAKEQNLKNLDDWIAFTKSPKFEPYVGIIPRKPWVYYSKKNVLKRLLKEGS